MHTPLSPQARMRAVSRQDIKGRSHVEMSLLAYCYGKIIARVRVTLRDLSTLPGPSGNPIGTSCAMQAVKDLMDEGLLYVVDLDRAALDQPLEMKAPGQQKQVFKAPDGKITVVKKGPPLWSTGEKVFGLWLPKKLPSVLRDELSRANGELTALYRKHPPQNGAVPMDEQVVLTARKAQALRSWLKLHPGSARIVAAVQQAEKAHADIVRQRDSRKPETPKTSEVGG